MKKHVILSNAKDLLSVERGRRSKSKSVASLRMTALGWIKHSRSTGLLMVDPALRALIHPTSELR